MQDLGIPAAALPPATRPPQHCHHPPSGLRRPGADSLENALKLASTAAVVFVIGGEQTYTQAMVFTGRLEITEVEQEPEGDAWFPKIAAVDWEKTAKTKGAGFSFITYRKRIG